MLNWKWIRNVTAVIGTAALLYSCSSDSVPATSDLNEASNESEGDANAAEEITDAATNSLGAGLTIGNIGSITQAIDVNTTVDDGQGGMVTVNGSITEDPPGGNLTAVGTWRTRVINWIATLNAGVYGLTGTTTLNGIAHAINLAWTGKGAARQWQRRVWGGIDVLNPPTNNNNNTGTFDFSQCTGNTTDQCVLAGCGSQASYNNCVEISGNQSNLCQIILTCARAFVNCVCQNGTYTQDPNVITSCQQTATTCVQ